MSSEKRDLSNLQDYEGEIIKEKNLYEFPALFKMDSRGKLREWNIYVRLIKTPEKSEIAKTNKVDWSLLINDQLQIKNKYITNADSLPEYSVGQYWTVSGEKNGKRTRHPPSYGSEKNTGRANMRNALQTAIISARNEYLKKIKRGYSTKINDKEDDTNSRYFPMLPKKYKEDFRKIKYPCYVQPKIDGTRVVAFLAKYEDSSEVILYSRELKDIVGKDEIKNQLKPILEKFYNCEQKESLYIDFEFYEHGKKLQEISGILRREKGKSLQAWIFDTFYPSKLKSEKFKCRNKRMREIFKFASSLKNMSEITLEFDKNKIVELSDEWLSNMKKCLKVSDKKKYFKTCEIENEESAISLNEEIHKFENEKFMDLKIDVVGKLVRVPTILCRTRVEEEFLYWGFITCHFEGTIVRNKNGIYRASNKTKNAYLRSPDVQKRKRLFTQEYELYDFTEGKRGREKGALIWVFKIKGKEVKAVPKNTTIEARKELFDKFCKDKTLFSRKYKGKLVTIEYEDISKDGIPQRLKALGIRVFT